MNSTLRDIFHSGVALAPDAIFLEDAQHCLTYQTAFDIAYLRAQLLLTQGATFGERVVIIDNNPAETALWLFACILIGVIAIILHFSTSNIRLKYILQDLTPVGIIDVSIEHIQIYNEQSHVQFVISSNYVKNPTVFFDIFTNITILETDAAFLVYTSGSTSEPKAVICPHRAVLAVTASIGAYLQQIAEDRLGLFLSFSFVYGLYQLFLTIQAQASIVFLEFFRSPIELIEQLKMRQITAFPAVPPVLMQLARIDKNRCQVETLRYITSAGDYLPSNVIQAIISRFSTTSLFSMYGLSECSRAMYMPPEKLPNKPDSVGRPISGTRAFIINNAGEVLPPGEVGELIIEGSNVMNGYWHAPEETALHFFWGPYQEPRLRTGDLFWQDVEGDFYFVSRKSDLIKSKGFRISPREVETLIRKVNAFIQDCIVYGVDDMLLGQAICAEIVVNDSKHTTSEILHNCRAAMDPHLIPNRIKIVTHLPKTLSGKYYRRIIKQKEEL